HFRVYRDFLKRLLLKKRKPPPKLLLLLPRFPKQLIFCEVKKTIQDAILKLDEALEVNPKKSLALFQMSNAYSRLGHLTSDPDEMVYYFSKASEYSSKSCDETAPKKKNSDLKYDIMGWSP
ncbi:hypothetical protein V2J09_005986, partial [Rumex salicifolius]